MGWNSSWVEIRTGKSLTLSRTQLHSGSLASPSSFVSPLHWGLSEGNSCSSQHLGHLFSSSFFPDLGAPGLFLGFYPFSSTCPAFLPFTEHLSRRFQPGWEARLCLVLGLECLGGWASCVLLRAAPASPLRAPLLPETPKTMGFCIEWERRPHSSCYHLGWEQTGEPWSPRAAQSLALWRAEVASWT